MSDAAKKWSTQAAEKLFTALNRADEIGGEIRDFVTEKMATDPRYVTARKTIAKYLGKEYVSKQEVVHKAQVKAERVASVAAVTPAVKAVKTLGDPALKAQIYGKKSCPWTGRAITLLEKQKIDYDYVDLEEPEHEAKITPLTLETKQHTVPFIYLRGKFIGGFNALSEIDRLGQLDVAMMSDEEKAANPHVMKVEIVPRPNTDEVAPAEVESREAPSE